MAVAYDNQAQAFLYGGSFSTSFTIGTGSNRILFAFFFGVSSTTAGITVSSIAYNGVSMTYLGEVSALSGSEANKILVYYLLESSLPTGGSAYNLTGSLGSSAWIGGVHIMSLSGAKQAAPEVANYFYDITSRTSWSNSITTLTDNAWIVEATSIYNGYSASPSSGQTQRGTNLALYYSYNGCISTELKSTAGSETNGWSWTGNSYINLHVLLSVAPPTSGVALSAAVGDTDQVAAIVLPNRGLAAVIGDTDQVAANVLPNRGLSAVVVDTDQVAANVLPRRGLSAIVENGDQVLGALAVARALSAIIANTDSVVGDLLANRALAALIADTDQVLGALMGNRGISAAVDEDDQVLGELLATRGLSIAIEEHDELAATLLRRYAIAAAIAEDDQVLTALGLALPLSASLEEVDEVLGIVFPFKGLTAKVREIDDAMGGVLVDRGLAAAIENVDEVLGAIVMTRGLTTTIAELDEVLSGLNAAYALSTAVNELDRVVIALENLKKYERVASVLVHVVPDSEVGVHVLGMPR